MFHLWIESRMFRRKPPIQEVFDFFIANAKLHIEFDKFREEETNPDENKVVYRYKFSSIIIMSGKTTCISACQYTPIYFCIYNNE